MYSKMCILPNFKLGKIKKKKNKETPLFGWEKIDFPLKFN